MRRAWAVDPTVDVTYRAQQVHQAAYGPRPKRARLPLPTRPVGPAPGPRQPR